MDKLLGIIERKYREQWDITCWDLYLLTQYLANSTVCLSILPRGNDLLTDLFQGSHLISSPEGINISSLCAESHFEEVDLILGGRHPITETLDLIDQRLRSPGPIDIFIPNVTSLLYQSVLGNKRVDSHNNSLAIELLSWDELKVVDSSSSSCLLSRATCQ